MVPVGASVPSPTQIAPHLATNPDAGTCVFWYQHQGDVWAPKSYDTHWLLLSIPSQPRTPERRLLVFPGTEERVSGWGALSRGDLEGRERSRKRGENQE